MHRRTAGTALAVAALLVMPATDASASTVLRLDGVGPLRLGMTRTAALATGWLAERKPGCELGGPPLPITYRLTGRHAPNDLRGAAEFRGGRLRGLSFTAGVRTATGVAVRTTTTATMVARYRSAGFTASAQFVPTFGGTFVDVRRGGRQVLGGFAHRRVVTTLAIPRVPVCE
jgi:hypothetical protein